MNYLIVFILIIFSALFSGLTLGLMSLSAQELKRKASLGDKDAKKVYPIRSKGNLLLCTLLVGNVAINSAIAIFLGSIASGVAAGLIATGLIVIFGEILPQAVFSRFALVLGAKTVWIVKIFLYILYPICWPIAWMLDKALGEELTTIYSKKELMKIMEEHKEDQDSDIGIEEERIVKGALTFSDKEVKDVMTPRTVMFALEFSEKIDKKLFDLISESSYSRIPVYKDNKDNIVGILYVSDLLGSKNLNKTIGEVVNKELFFVNENKKLNEVFNSFLKTRHHLFIAVNNFNEVIGVITLEDVIEEIVSSEIMDENDRYADLRKIAKIKRAGKKI